MAAIARNFPHGSRNRENKDSKIFLFSSSVLLADMFYLPNSIRSQRAREPG
jgi:hypothetical protein